jgi:hypothetical protein
MTDEAYHSARGRLVADILNQSGLPNAPLAMPKQVLESRSSWLFAIYARLLRRT